MIKKFPWGKVIVTFTYDFDGKELEVIKYNPWIVKKCIYTSKPDLSSVLYFYENEEMNESFTNIQSLLISLMIKKNLGYNQHGLQDGICRALNIKENSF